jgi:hypothetical protein
LECQVRADNWAPAISGGTARNYGSEFELSFSGLSFSSPGFSFSGLSFSSPGFSFSGLSFSGLSFSFSGLSCLVWSPDDGHATSVNDNVLSTDIATIRRANFLLMVLPPVVEFIARYPGNEQVPKT